MTDLFKNIFIYITDFFFPSSCILCGNYLDNHIYVCRECLDHLPLNKNENRSSISVFDYGEDIRLLIHELKYNQRPEIGIVLGCEAGKRLKGIIDPSISVLMPIPLHKKRLKKRGYNQSDMISEGLSNFLNLPLKKDLMIRLKNNVSQTTLNAENRGLNVRGIFGIDKNLDDKNKLILMIDDVITTGSTTKEAGSVLKNNGYNNIFSISIATVK